MLSLSLPSPTYFLFLLFFSVYLEDFSFEKHIFSSVRDGWRSGKLGLAICPVSEDLRSQLKPWRRPSATLSFL